MALDVDEVMFPFDISYYFDPSINDWEQNPELLVLQYIYVMRKWSKECNSLLTTYERTKQLDNYYHHDKPKKAVIEIFNQFCTSKKRYLLSNSGCYHLSDSFDHEIKDYHHLEIDKNFCEVFFTNKKGLPLYKFALKYLKKRWYIDDFYYFRNMQQWQLREL